MSGWGKRPLPWLRASNSESESDSGESERAREGGGEREQARERSREGEALSVCLSICVSTIYLSTCLPASSACVPAYYSLSVCLAVYIRLVHELFGSWNL